MPDDRAHPALGIQISPANARRLFPGTPNKVFWWAGRAHGAGVRLSFGTAFRVATEYWTAEAKSAQASRFSIMHKSAWKARRAAAAEAGLIHLREAIDRELAALAGQEA